MHAGIAVICLAVACGNRADGPRSSIVAALAPAPLVFPPLTWDLSEDEALARLDQANMGPRAEEMRGYFTTPDQLHAAPGTIEVAHTTEPMVIFTPRRGWTGSAHYPTVGGKLDLVEIRATLESHDAAADELAALELRLGPPDDRRIFPGDAGSVGSLRMVWVRGGIWLVAFAGPTGELSMAYRTDDRPASAIGP